MTLPELDPLWVSVFVTVVLVIITGYYAWQAKKTTDITKMTLLYQRKPHLKTKIENVGNDINCSLENDEKSISSMENIDVKLYMKIAEDSYELGKYHVDGPLLPGEKDSPYINSLIIKKLKELDLMTSHTVKYPQEDKFGRQYMAEFGVFDIKKKRIDFDIVIETSFETDIKDFKQNRFTINRIFKVSLIMRDEPPNEYDDNYDTNIKMKFGQWLE